MAVTRSEISINMASGTAERTVSDANWALSDAFAVAAGDWDVHLMLWSDNQGTPASGDTVEWRLLASLGSVDGSAGDDYVNVDNGMFLDLHDTYNNDDGNGVVFSVVGPISATPEYYKLAVKAVNGATRNVKVRAMAQVLQGAIS